MQEQLTAFLYDGYIIFKWVKIDLLLDLELLIGFQNGKFATDTSGYNNAKGKQLIHCSVIVGNISSK